VLRASAGVQWLMCQSRRTATEFEISDHTPIFTVP
jgi:hypothetical protein